MGCAPYQSHSCFVFNTINTNEGHHLLKQTERDSMQPAGGRHAALKARVPPPRSRARPPASWHQRSSPFRFLRREAPVIVLGLDRAPSVPSWATAASMPRCAAAAAVHNLLVTLAPAVLRSSLCYADHCIAHDGAVSEQNLEAVAAVSQSFPDPVYLDQRSHHT